MFRLLLPSNSSGRLSRNLSLLSLYTPLPRELIISQLAIDGCTNTMLMNFKAITSHSRLYSCRHFKISPLTCPALSSEFYTASVKNRFLLQLINFHWSITILSISKLKSQLGYRISCIISIWDTTRSSSRFNNILALSPCIWSRSDLSPHLWVTFPIPSYSHTRLILK